MAPCSDFDHVQKHLVKFMSLIWEICWEYRSPAWEMYGTGRIGNIESLQKFCSFSIQYIWVHDLLVIWEEIKPADLFRSAPWGRPCESSGSLTLPKAPPKSSSPWKRSLWVLWLRHSAHTTVHRPPWQILTKISGTGHNFGDQYGQCRNCSLLRTPYFPEAFTSIAINQPIN